MCTQEPFIIIPTQEFCKNIVSNCNKIISWAMQGQEEWAVAVLDSAAMVSGGYDTAMARASLTPLCHGHDPKDRAKEESVGRLDRMKEQVKRKVGLKGRMILLDPLKDHWPRG